MTIDISELRRLALDGDLAAMQEIILRLKAAEKSDAESLAMYRKARDERDALRAKLEATEEDRSRFLVEMGRLCAQCDALRAEIEELHVLIAAVKKEEEYTRLRAKIEQTGKMREPLRRHHENAMGAGLDPSHSLTKLRVSAYQQTCLYADTVAALEESK